MTRRKARPVAAMRRVAPMAKGFPPGHWEYLKKFPKVKGDSTRFISEDRDRGFCETMCDMIRLNARDLHRRTGAILDQVAKGDVIVIEKRGVPVAEIRPIQPIGKPFPPGRWEFLKKFPKVKGDSTKFISEDRDHGL